MNMNIIITMAGLGSRFSKVGYTCPKYMIKAHNKTLFEWSITSLTDFINNESFFVFISRKDDDAKTFITEKCKKTNINNYKIIEIPNITDGQATTAMLAKEYWQKEDPILIYNIDTYIEENEFNYSQIKGDGFIPCFKAEGDHWSFVKADNDNKAIEVKEKIRISNLCSVGAYYFKSCNLFEKLYREYYSLSNNSESKEKYIAPLYNHLINSGGKVFVSIIESSKIHVLGTPNELEVFIKSNL